MPNSERSGRRAMCAWHLLARSYGTILTSDIVTIYSQLSSQDNYLIWAGSIISMNTFAHRIRLDGYRIAITVMKCAVRVYAS